MSKPFEIIRHSTDANGKRIVDIFGVCLSNRNSIKLRDELNRLLPPSPEEKLVDGLQADEHVETIRELTDQLREARQNHNTAKT